MEHTRPRPEVCLISNYLFRLETTRFEKDSDCSWLKWIQSCSDVIAWSFLIDPETEILLSFFMFCTVHSYNLIFKIFELYLNLILRFITINILAIAPLYIGLYLSPCKLAALKIYYYYYYHPYIVLWIQIFKINICWKYLPQYTFSYLAYYKKPVNKKY